MHVVAVFTKKTIGTFNRSEKPSGTGILSTLVVLNAQWRSRHPHLVEEHLTWRCLPQAAFFFRALQMAVGVMCLGLSWAAFANGEPPIQQLQYVHQSWTIRDGAPPAVCAIVQGPDGYLWLGTGTGLYRFDGVQFLRYRPELGQRLASSNITALRFSADGRLWIGFYDGGAALLKDGKLTAYSIRDGFPPGWVLDFAEAADGQLWVATGQGLGYFDGASWHQVSHDWNYPADRADWVVFDASGTLWVAAVNRLVYLRAGARQFQSTNVALAPGAVLGLDEHGTLWASDRLHGTRPLRGLSADHPDVAGLDSLPVSDEGAAQRFAFDSHGGLWETALGTGGLLHVSHPEWIGQGKNVNAKVLSRIFTAPRGLTSNNAIPVMEDREGNIWVGTSLGIDSYRRSEVGTLSDLHAAPYGRMSLAKDPHGTLWLSNLGSVYAMKDEGLERVLPGLPDILSFLFADNGTLWVVGFHDLYREQSGKLEKVPLPNHLYSSRLKFIAADEQGGIWASIEGLGIFTFGNGAWQKWVPRTEGLMVSPTAIAIGADGSKWFGYIGSELLHVDSRGQEKRYDVGSGVDIGTVEAISIGTHDTLFGGDSGLARVHGNTIQSMTDRNYPALTGITGIVQGGNGDVWINTGRGVVRYSASELGHAFDDPHYRAEFELFDYRDGVQGVARQGQPVSTMQSDSKGRVWFVTNEGLQWIDLSNLRRNPLPPPVYIKSVSAEGMQYESGGAITLPKGVTAMQVDYTALSLSSPTRVRFRYRLDGVDKDWVDVGTRRQAFYTNLSPGTYRFTVIASNGHGVWSAHGAEATIDILPRFYQTQWFRAIVVLLVVACVMLAYLARIRRVTRNIRLQSDARHEERERIARDLHDTLLQAVHALMLRFQSLAAAIPENDPLQDSIASTMKIAGSFIIEGRDRVKALRVELHSTGSVSNAIVQLAASLERADSIEVETEVRIEDRPIDPALGDNIFSICREALINAFRHAKASLISVHITETRRHLRIVVADNGKGIPSTTLENPIGTGHWGIIGMHERAVQSGVQLSISSTPTGTTVNLEMPFRSFKR